MATYDLKYPGAAIDAILDTAYDLQNAGYIFRGLASEYSNTPTERSWVLAGEGETYGGSLSGSGYKLPHIAANYSFYWPGATGGATTKYSGNPDPSRTSGGSSDNTGSTTAANGSAHNNLQPYITCYMFKRTA